MFWTFLGLAFDIFGAVLLVWGELKGGMAMLNYQSTGDARNLEQQLRKFPRWKRWPLSLGMRFGSQRELGQEALLDSFPLIAWGILCLILGFILQGIGNYFACAN